MKPTSKHVRDIRQGRYGDNPYVVVNVATWKPKDHAIRTYVDAGVDDILIMPALFDAVATRVDNIVDNRKKFIATQKYMGPDRRNPNRAKQDELRGFVVPNGVR
ncbi:MAG: hypothetical protein CMM31_08235 [Rhodospirillaceae bacterium]|nr:hypothetical protein [Rhodospirillaceae bacterium]